ncbi:efflux RND transporter periplasmic adaptor subunit [Methylomonas sp. HYX-M1]|uniref:efflux RND transporter periplasmic adaptor subunit n=1 Tax=Methylomonas sp. HYX-M1 TaxID=3139307 RepID=UPI00345B6DDA
MKFRLTAALQPVAAGICAVFSAVSAAKPVECLIEPSQIVEVRAPVDGLIETIAVDRGDKIKQGQVLVTLDSGVERARFAQAKFKSTTRGAQLAAQSRVEFSGKKFERDRELYKDQYVSANAVDESESSQRQAAADLIAARDNNRIAELEVREYEELIRLKTLKSPFDGVVLERSHHPGEVAQINDRLPILKLAKIDPVFIEVVLPAAALGKIKTGEVFKVFPHAGETAEFTARVGVIDPVLDAASGTLGVRLQAENAAGRIPAGISCQIEMPQL